MDTASACRKVYEETNAVYSQSKQRLGVNDLGFKILYGPPHQNAPILFIGDQPGGAVKDEKEDERFSWPNVCEYATETWHLAKNMRAMFGLTLLKDCVGVNTNFFRAPNVKTWQKIPAVVRNALEQFSREKLLEIIRITNPKQIVVIGLGTLDKFGPTTPNLSSANGRVLVKRGQLDGWPAISTLHLSGAQISGDDRRAIAEFIFKSIARGSGTSDHNKPDSKLRSADEREHGEGKEQLRIELANRYETQSNIDPKQSLLLLDKLNNLGFKNEDFRRLHHLRDSISSFRRYCHKIGFFKVNESNYLLHRRLEFVLAAYHSQEEGKAIAQLFSLLAERSFAEIPPRPDG